MSFFGKAAAKVALRNCRWGTVAGENVNASKFTSLETEGEEEITLLRTDGDETTNAVFSYLLAGIRSTLRCMLSACVSPVVVLWIVLVGAERGATGCMASPFCIILLAATTFLLLFMMILCIKNRCNITK